MRLPASFHEIVNNIYPELVQIILENMKEKPLLVSINGAQGTGKTTMTAFIRRIIESELGCTVAELSLDDFYFTRTERERLSSEVHPLFITRGVPGTHDINLMENALDDLVGRNSCLAPRFDKSIDDRCDVSNWVRYDDPVEVILFEGWCNSSPYQNRQELVHPVNELERTEDTEGVWREYANEKLMEYHRRIFNHTDMCIMLKAPGFQHVYEWRSMQEKKLLTAAVSHKHRVMNDKELRRFIQHFERISRHTLQYLPDIADVVLPVATDHSITGIIKHG